MTAADLPELDLATYPLVAAICFVAAILGGMSGFGSGLIIAALAAPLVGVKAVVPLISVVMMITNSSRIWVYGKDLDLRLAAVLLATSVPASILGSFIYVRLDAELISTLLGVVLVASPLLNAALRRRRFRAGPWAMAALGLAFGLLSSNIIGAGLLIPPILLGAGLVGPAVLATDAAVAVGTSVFRVITFGSLEALTVPIAVAGVLMGLCTIPGTWVAAWMMRRTSLRVHTVLIEAFVVLAGLGFIWRGLAAS
ncbi:MAG TPA: sulfite exporter TauE/SafE family protein [Mesorhizobium sp.]|jgi:hypothetical protein|nr:sulfite exporter TauE/SafE family protein [Mesorhizobium sp.]